MKACASRLELKTSEQALLKSEENNDRADSILEGALSRL